MIVTCTKENLIRGLNLIEHALGKNATLPVLEHVSMRTQAGKLILSATDLEIAVVVNVPAKAEEEASWTVPAKVLAGLISSLPDGPVQIKHLGKSITVKGKGFSGKLHAGNADDFPIIPELVNAKRIVMDAGPILAALESTVGATAVTESRPELSGVSLVAQGSEIRIAATDTFRLALRVLPYEDADEFSLIIPSRAAQEITRLFKDEEKITLMISENQCAVETEELSFTSRLIEGSFPDYESIIPSENVAALTVSREGLLEKLEAATYFVSRLNDVKLTTKKDGKSLLIKAQNSDVGEYLTEVEAEEREGNEQEAAFNIRYLMDGVRSFKDTEIRVALNGSEKPALIKPTGKDEKSLYLIMPIRTT